MGGSIKNISLRLFRQFLTSKGLKVIRTNGGHEIWGGKQLLRPIVIQTHIDPIPEFVIKNNLRNMGVTVEDFLKFCEN
jgi:hypothetical protein